MNKARIDPAIRWPRGGNAWDFAWQIAVRPAHGSTDMEAEDGWFMPGVYHKRAGEFEGRRTLPKTDLEAGKVL